MHEPPEIAYEMATPEQLLKRLDILRERFRTGLMSVGDFNTAIKAYQFNDDVGHLWAPGATTSRWYRWDDGKWTVATPPSRLRVNQTPIMFIDFDEEKPPVAAAPAGVSCPKCGAKNVGKKFCTQCGTKLT